MTTEVSLAALVASPSPHFFSRQVGASLTEHRADLRFSFLSYLPLSSPLSALFPNSPTFFRNQTSPSLKSTTSSASPSEERSPRHPPPTTHPPPNQPSSRSTDCKTSSSKPRVYRNLIHPLQPSPSPSPSLPSPPTSPPSQPPPTPSSPLRRPSQLGRSPPSQQPSSNQLSSLISFLQQ